MYWLKRSLLPRRVVAVLMVVIALAWDLRGAATTAYPFAASAARRGDPVTVEWRQVPAGLLPEPAPGGFAAADLAAGTPLLAALVTVGADIPEGWWTVPVESAGHATLGDTVMLVATDPPLRTIGIVTAKGSGDRYSGSYRPTLVAVAEADAPLVAAAAARGNLLVAIRDAGTTPGGR